MSTGYVFVKQSGPLIGQVSLSGAKNAVLVIMASLILTRGKSVLRNVPAIADVYEMIEILKSLGASIQFDAEKNILHVDTTHLEPGNLNQDAVRKFRASLLIFGPLLTQFKNVQVAMPGGDAIGVRPLDYHIKNFKKLGADVWQDAHFLYGKADKLHAQRLVLDYPSVGATENLLMALTLVQGESWIVNAALEPEVLDLIACLQKMGADVQVWPPAMIKIRGVQSLKPVDHTIICDRLEAGSLLIAGAITKGDIFIPNAAALEMELFLMKLSEMGHEIEIGKDGQGIRLKACKNPIAVSFKTGPYPGFPTDLQALMMAAQTIAHGTCNIVETVFENRFLHVPEMNKMGAKISASGHYAQLEGTPQLEGAEVVATDIRAACALALLGLAAHGTTMVQKGVHHWKRGYETLEEKLRQLGACIELR
ncbi:MAG TPA: UDP-N-acetylglucosamine 1-carboxyvinyltransferase [Candidatus Saccharimonadales bacterium]|nr:UDP-N-acetylglucosamine 1-carboxyvinyltransferase [Candidatus Saccharimonadales bacterium]